MFFSMEQIMRELNNSDMTLHIEANLAGRDRELPEGTVGTEYKVWPLTHFFFCFLL